MPDSALENNTVGMLQGDRLCVHCGYNLIGQPVRRFDDLNLVAARCPECGTFAALQEYPALGRWAGRWTALIAAAWFIALLGALLISALVISGYGRSGVDEAARDYAAHLAWKQDSWVESTGFDTSAAYPYYGQRGDPYYEPLIQEWWTLQDEEALLRQAGGPLAMMNWSAARRWYWMTLIVLPVGCFWSVALLHIRRRWLLAVAFVVSGTALLLVPVLDRAFALPFPSYWIGAVADDAIGRVFMLMTVAVAVVPLYIGMLIGRPVARFAVRTLLPPHLRSAFAFLWTAEGKRPPQRAFWEQPVGSEAEP